MLTRTDLDKMKKANDKISMVTAYDYASASILEKAGVDIILVGDSLGMVVLGYSSTIQVTLEDMLHHAKAVKRGAKDTLIVVDMPFMTYHISLEDSLKNAQRLFQETDSQALKIEGASTEVLTLIKRLANAGIPVVAHIGLTPQSVNVLGGYKVQGKDDTSKEKLIQDAKNIAEAGAIALVLECIPKELGKEITEAISIPTIGIGAGVHCDGQVLVYHDMMNYGVEKRPKFAKKYTDYSTNATEALTTFIKEVKEESFPSDAYSF